jgi:hypothetical protein
MSQESARSEIGVILEQLRAEVRARRMAGGVAELSPVEQDLRRSLDDIELYRVISAHWPLKPRSPLDRVVVLINKIVRRLLRWYINPIVEQQNAYNDAVARALRLLAEAYTELAEELRPQQPLESPQPWPGDPGSGNGASAPASLPEGLPPAPLTHQRDMLQELVERRGAVEPPARFVELELQALVPLLEQRRHVSAHWPIEGHAPGQRVIAFAQKLVRQYLRWLINPIVEQQNAANEAIGVVVRDLARLDAIRRAESAALRARRAARE